MWGKGCIRRTTIISFGLVFFLIGLALGRHWQVSVWLSLAGAIGLSPLLFSRNTLSLLSICVIGLLLGCWRGAVFTQRMLPYSTLAKRPMVILATATSDAVYGPRTQLEFDVGQIKLIKPYRQNLVGTIGVRGFGEPMIYRGDKVLVAAKLYPSRGSRSGRLSFAKIQKISSDNSVIHKLQRRFAASLQSVLPEPLGSLALGVLIGQRTTLPDDVNQQLSTVGLTHIVAVSGYNLTIVVLFARRGLGKRSKYQSTIATLGLIGLFLAVTGASASIVRAAIVSCLSLLAWYYGRTFKPHLLILLAATITAGAFPPYLWTDIAWWLSFLAFAGVLMVAPLAQKHLRWNERHTFLLLLLEAWAAQLMTLPIIMFTFGRLSLVALLANLLVVPLVPLAMATSFVAGLAGMVLPAVGGWVAWPAKVLLVYMLDVVRLLARLPKASIDQSISAAQLVAAYGLISAAVFTWSRKKVKLTDRIQHQTAGDIEAG